MFVLDNDPKVFGYKSHSPVKKEVLKSEPKSSPRKTILDSTDEIKEDKKKVPKVFCIVSLIIGIIIIASSVCIAIILTKKKKKRPDNNGISTGGGEEKEREEEEEEEENIVENLKRINVAQTSYNNMTINGKDTQLLIYRNTTYDIYIISKNYSDDYNGVINIVSECFSNESEICEQVNNMNLSFEENKTGLRRLPELRDLNDIKIPVCFFNLSDNNVINSFNCLSETRKDQMKLDLSFFRPPAIEKSEKGNPLKTISSEKHQLNNGGTLYIEQSSGVCDVYNALSTNCTTYMKTTTDINNSLITYEEVSFSNFITGENNSCTKTKITHLKDITDEIKNLNQDEYKTLLSKIIGDLKYYLQEKDDEYFSDDENEKSNDKNFSVINPYVKEENIFSKDINGVKITLNFINDIGIDKSFMRASSLLSFDDKNYELVSQNKTSHINILLEELIILSKAVNKLANDLYEQIKNKLNDITKDITSNLSSLNGLIVYQDLFSIFESALSVEKINILPKEIISESQNLFKKIENKLNDKTEITNYKNSLNSNIYNFLNDSHYLTNGLLEKIKELNNKLGSRSDEFSTIATYYLNYTSTSYNTIVSKVENILRNYYFNEAVLISNEINSISKSFEENIKNSVEKEINIIENIKTKLQNGNMSINLGTEDDIKNVILNLNKSITGISDVISEYNKTIISSLELKPNGYLIDENEIESVQKSVNDTIKKANEIALKLNDDYYFIDKKFDEIMINFRHNFTQLSDYMKSKRDENFLLLEDALENNKFNQSEKKKFSDDLETLRSSIVNEIKNENDNYINETTKKINDLISLKKEPLSQLIKSVDVFFSEMLEKLSYLYNKTFENSLELITNQITKNKQLADEYLDYLYYVLSNNSETIINVDPTLSYLINKKLIDMSKLENYIQNRTLTENYSKKYNKFLSSFESAKNYINNQMYIDLFNEYKNLMVKLKTILQSIKNDKFNDKYDGSMELAFVDDNIRIIDNLYNRIDKYFSETLYEENYLKKFDTFKKIKNKEIENIKQNLIEKNNLLTNHYTISNINYNDFCVTTFDSRNICTNLLHYSNNNNLLVSLSIYSENNTKELQTEFNDFYSFLNQNISEYNKVLTDLKNEIVSLENNTITIKEQLSSLSDLNKIINSFLDQKYGKILINDSYVFYKKNIENKIENFLNDISEKWVESFQITQSEVSLNSKKFKNPVIAFYILSNIYKDQVADDIIYNYTDTIIIQQENEFNYTISYYYNYLYTLVNRTYQYIIGKIPINKNGLNDIVNYRKNQIIEKYNEIMKKIKDSEANALKEKTQINLLIVPKTNFFKVNSLIQGKILDLSNKLSNLVTTIMINATQIGRDDSGYSVAARLYLENSQNGKIIQELTNSIFNDDFINLHQENFKELIDNHTTFDQENLTSSINTIISQSTTEIPILYKRNREKYIEQLENEIKNYLTKESLAEKIHLLYKNGVNDLDENLRNKIISNVSEILELISNHLKNESSRIETNSSYNQNYETINKTINDYKNEIFNKVKNEMIYLFETLRKNIYDKIYTNYVEKGLDEYLTGVKSQTSQSSKFKEYKTLGASYNIRDEINNIAKDLSNQYKYFTKEIIENTVIKSNYYKTLNLEDLEQLINDKLESSFTSCLLPALKKNVNNGNLTYDLNEDIKNNIQSKIDENVQVIKNIMDSTKGNNYDLQLDFNKDWKNIDFSNIGRIVEQIGESFELYFTYELNEEKKSLNNYLENVIKSNFDEMLNNFITTFGDKFFERISEYNLLFKIDILFNNFNYAFLQTVFYYYFAFAFGGNKYKQPKDLKNKILKINDHDLTIEQNKDIVIKILDAKIDDFIKETSGYLINQYISYMGKDENNTEFSNMNEEVKDLIKNNLILSKIDLENKYKNSLQNHLKDPLIKKCEKYLEEMKNKLIESVKEYQQDISSQLKSISTIDSEEQLNQINEKINSTLEQIDSYNKHFNQFKIAENIKQFLLTYGDNSINPLFENITNLINSATKDKILQNLNENSGNYEKKLNISSFKNKINEFYSFFNRSYDYFISEQISKYDSQNYEDKLQNEKEKIKNKRRRNLENTEKGLDDKSLDDTFSQLLDTADNVQNYVESMNEFNEYDKKISNYIIDIKNAVKNSSRLIDEYTFEENITNTLKNRLSYLEEISLSYYNDVNNSFSNIRNYIKDSINRINNELKKCSNATYESLEKNYKYISSNENYKSINKTCPENEKKLNEIKYEYESNTQNGRTNFETKISNLTDCSEFKFEIKYEETKNIKRPIVFASITNNNIPDEIEIVSSETTGDGGKEGHEYIVKFKDASYSTIINFDTKSSTINLTTLFKYDKYSYTSVPLVKKMIPIDKPLCLSDRKKKACFRTFEISKPENLSEGQLIYIDGKELNNTEFLEY